MRTRSIIIFAVAGLLLGAAIGTWRLLAKPAAVIPVGISMQLRSSAFGQNEAIPSKYTCDGENLSPPLSIVGVPETAKSLALIVDDPDAPGGSWVHWTLWNLPPGTVALEEGARAAPGAVEGFTSFGRSGYGGPCPPSGTHRYFFKIYALDASLDLPASADVDDLERAMGGHVLDKAGLVGLYGR